MPKIPLYLLPIIIALFAVSCISSRPPFDEVKWRNEVNSCDVSALYAPHYKDGRYFNPWMPMESRGLADLLKWRLSRRDDYPEKKETDAPRVIAGLKNRILSRPDGDFIAWVGHATFLMRLSGEYWLIDPIFSERALLPKRHTPPALSIAEMRELPWELNIIVSHNHYDHLDEPTMRALPEHARVFVPLGMKRSIESMNKKHVQEMDWWQTLDCGNGVKIICLPAQHWSRRITEGTNKTLWGSFLIITPTVTVYYGGDSGYFIGYKEIGRLYPKIDFALLPITAYHPRWFMHYAHMNVKEAIDAFHDLGATYMIPTQWGTFQLGDEPIGHAGSELKRLIKEGGLDPARFLIMDIGQILPLTGK